MVENGRKKPRSQVLCLCCILGRRRRPETGRPGLTALTGSDASLWAIRRVLGPPIPGHSLRNSSALPFGASASEYVFTCKVELMSFSPEKFSSWGGHSPPNPQLSTAGAGKASTPLSPPQR